MSLSDDEMDASILQARGSQLLPAELMSLSKDNIPADPLIPQARGSQLLSAGPLPLSEDDIPANPFIPRARGSQRVRVLKDPDPQSSGSNSRPYATRRRRLAPSGSEETHWDHAPFIPPPEPAQSNPDTTMEHGRMLDEKTMQALISRLWSILNDKTKYRTLLRSTGNRAQQLLDSFQSILDYPGLEPAVRRSIIVGAQRLSQNTGLYPTCYNLVYVDINVKRVAYGGFADIYKGTMLRRPVCVKVIKQLQQKEQVDYVLKKHASSKEGILWGQLQHPNLLSIYGVYRLKNNSICFVSPWMHHGDISNYLNKYPQVDRLLLVSDITLGMAYLHKNDIIHGDLKGPNILVSKSGVARIADFGLSSISDSRILAWTSNSSPASKGGTTRYRAPEQFDPAEDTDPKNSTASDVYAWACVCYEIFSGKIPFGVLKDPTVILRVQQGRRPARPQDGSEPWTEWGLTEDIWALMEEGWVQDPSLRPTVEQLLERLRPILPEDTRQVAAGDPEELSPLLVRQRLRPQLDEKVFGEVLERIELLPADRSRGILVERILAALAAIVDDEAKHKLLLESEPSDMQQLMDVLPVLLDSPELDSASQNNIILVMQALLLKTGIHQIRHSLSQGQYDKEPVATGAIGDIYRGTLFSYPVCVKVIRRLSEESRVQHLLKRLATSKAAILWSHLSHPNLLSIYGVYQHDNNKICVVSPWMHYGNITSYLMRNPGINRLHIISDITQGLRFLHKHGIIHGNLTPINILVAKSGVACIADFGLSSVVDAKLMTWTSNHSLESSGTIRYQAPELLDPEDEEVAQNSEASDVYAWSCVSYQIFTGTAPFAHIPHSREIDILHQVLSGHRPPRPADSSPPWTSWGLTEDIWSLIQHGWTQDPAQRPTAPQLVAKLKQKIAKDEDTRVFDPAEILPHAKFRETMRPSPVDLKSALVILARNNLPIPDSGSVPVATPDELVKDGNTKIADRAEVLPHAEFRETIRHAPIYLKSFASKNLPIPVAEIQPQESTLLESVSGDGGSVVTPDESVETKVTTSQVLDYRTVEPQGGLRLCDFLTAAIVVAFVLIFLGGIRLYGFTPF
ncbi:hypothetical protein H0H81_010474 [Sphagnurus paluster]|uniref:Protein kinase domain-containing protein n=1 Tax=Sphagnurus paluster TaxID=117069 RepID=A0A9P7KL37_9AGAR|nr:hypothetical protein H0H81_010474 [Sphagnurus paluster]